jgi:hypothetical protein
MLDHFCKAESINEFLCFFEKHTDELDFLSFSQKILVETLVGCKAQNKLVTNKQINVMIQVIAWFEEADKLLRDCDLHGFLSYAFTAHDHAEQLRMEIGAELILLDINEYLKDLECLHFIAIDNIKLVKFFTTPSTQIETLCPGSVELTRNSFRDNHHRALLRIKSAQMAKYLFDTNLISVSFSLLLLFLCQQSDYVFHEKNQTPQENYDRHQSLLFFIISELSKFDGNLQEHPNLGDNLTKIARNLMGTSKWEVVEAFLNLPFIQTAESFKWFWCEQFWSRESIRCCLSSKHPQLFGMLLDKFQAVYSLHSSQPNHRKTPMFASSNKLIVQEVIDFCDITFVHTLFSKISNIEMFLQHYTGYGGKSIVFCCEFFHSYHKFLAVSIIEDAFLERFNNLALKIINYCHRISFFKTLQIQLDCTSNLFQLESDELLSNIFDFGQTHVCFQNKISCMFMSEWRTTLFSVFQSNPEYAQKFRHLHYLICCEKEKIQQIEALFYDHTPLAQTVIQYEIAKLL